MKRLGRTDRLLALTIFVAVLGTLVAAGRTQGNVRDEGYYFEAAKLYYGWYAELGENLVHGHPQRSFTRASIDHWFGYNHEHPALMKTLFGLSWHFLSKSHHLLDEQSAMRLPTNVVVALMCMLVYLLGAAAWSRWAGLAAAVLTIGSPRLFFDSQLACFDAPVAAFWVFVVYAYWRALQDPKWNWRAGVIFGLSLAVKHNSFFIPFVLILHYLWTQRARLRQRRFPPIPKVFFWMALVGPVVYLACWPWLWFDTVQRFREYVAFHAHHVFYNIEYLGRNYNKPPSPLSFPYVMTALTEPVTTLVLAAFGAVALFRAWRTEPAPAPAEPPSTAPGMLCVLNALFPMAILTFTGAPIFGATKHFHASLPFIALLAGYGLDSLLRALGSRRLVAPALTLLVCLPAVAETWRSHPYGLTHYNLLAGGPPGGADLGMNRQFWGYSTRGILPWLNAHARPGEPVYWHDTNQDQLDMDMRIGLLRPDIRNTGLEETGVKASDIAMVIHEMHFRKYEYWIWDFYGTTRPALVLTDEGVPIVTVYQRPGKSR